MDNNNLSPNNQQPPRKRKRVTKQMAQRRRLAALGILILIILLFIILIAKACSGDDKDNGKSKKPKSTTAAASTAAIVTHPVATTTTAPVSTADPNDPNTITKITLDVYSVNLEIGESQMPWVTMSPETSTEKGEIWKSSDEKIATVDDIGNITAVAGGECYVTVTSKNNPAVYAEVKVTVTDPNAAPSNAIGQTPTSASTDIANQSATAAKPEDATGGIVTVSDTKQIDGATYVQGILVANKSYSLPADYDPGLDPTTKSQFDVLSSAAAEEGLNIWLASGYRSYQYQEEIYNGYVDGYGKDTADTFSARPGHSEHQTGLAIDVNTIDDSFADTPEAEWLAENCYKYGFIIRYPKGKEDITGYKYEPWHIRYLGVEKATAVYNSGLTLEEYLGIDSKY